LGEKIDRYYLGRSLAVLSLFSVGTAIAQNNSLAAHADTANDRFAMK
jgi:hypothetical protein